MIIKISKDKEKAKSMLALIKNREDFVSSIDAGKFPTIVAESYYELIKELATAILLLDGLKAIGESAHKELIEELSKYKELGEWEIRMIDDLRVKRNKSSYEGKQIDASYIENKKGKLTVIIGKLKGILDKKLNL